MHRDTWILVYARVRKQYYSSFIIECILLCCLMSPDSALVIISVSSCLVLLTSPVFLGHFYLYLCCFYFTEFSLFCSLHHFYCIFLNDPVRIYLLYIMSTENNHFTFRVLQECDYICCLLFLAHKQVLRYL